jgi:hypothetical protein
MGPESAFLLCLWDLLSLGRCTGQELPFSPTRREEGGTFLPVVEFYPEPSFGRHDLPGENPQHETPLLPTAMDGLLPR